MPLHKFFAVYANLPLANRVKCIDFNAHGMLDLQQINNELHMLEDQIRPFKIEQDRLLTIATNHLIRTEQIMSDWDKLANHNHCRQCGKKLIKSLPFCVRYDEKEGEAIYQVQVTCPDYRWWKFSHHFNEIFEGDEMIVYYDY